jgi:hypothetical protein
VGRKTQIRRLLMSKTEGRMNKCPLGEAGDVIVCSDGLHWEEMEVRKAKLEVGCLINDFSYKYAISGLSGKNRPDLITLVEAIYTQFNKLKEDQNGLE